MSAFAPRYYGVPPTQQYVIEDRQDYTATAGQTDFAVNYTPGHIDVYYNGSLLDPRTEYTATDGEKIVLTTPATAGAIVLCRGRIYPAS